MTDEELTALIHATSSMRGEVGRYRLTKQAFAKHASATASLAEARRELGYSYRVNQRNMARADPRRTLGPRYMPSAYNGESVAQYHKSVRDCKDALEHTPTN